MYTTYVLYSKDFDKIYVGFTSDIEARLISHNHPKNKGWTKRYQQWEIIHQEFFMEKKDALKREQELESSRGRVFIRNEILKS
jgi:putative endonuclease